MIVCDGFTGNVALKVSEGLVEMIGGLLREELSGTIATPSWRRGVGAALAGLFRRRVDYSEYGGAPLLGVAGLALVGHGRSSAQGGAAGRRWRPHRFASTGFIARLQQEIARCSGVAPVIAFIFPGQGSQTVGHGQGAGRRVPTSAATTFAEADARSASR